jgi:beta-glucosidase/6-phospho-beta-glucosidase/beta-galactosidase
MPDSSTEPFLWGAATASYQIEGAAAEGGAPRRSGTSLPTRPGKSSAARQVTWPATITTVINRT